MSLWFAAAWFVVGHTLLAKPGHRLIAGFLARRRAGRYVERLERQLPDAFEGLAAALRAGRSLEQAVDWFAKEGPEPLAQEFAALGRAMRLGVAFEEALAEAAVRVELPGLQTAAYTLGPLRHAGANLVAVFEGMAAVLRRCAAAAGKLASLTAQAKLQLAFMGAVFPALLGSLFLLQPALVLRLFTEPSGRLYLALAIVLQGLSFAGARRILNPTSLWT